MTQSLDYLLLPIVRQPEHDQGIVPGLLVAEPPRRVARGRREEQLFLRLTLGGNAVIDTQEQLRMLEQAAQVYFRSSGAVTGAIRQSVALLNQEILSRNVHNSGRGLQTVGYLTVGVLRDGSLYLAQCGPTHALYAAAEAAEHYYDPHLAGRGLGLARTTQLRYLQIEPQVGDLLLLSTTPSPAWTPGFLQKRRSASLESLRRELIAQVEIDPFALLIQARPGSGNLQIARPKPVAVVQDQPAGSAIPPAGDPEPTVDSAPPAALSAAGGMLAGAPPPAELEPADSLPNADRLVGAADSAKTFPAAAVENIAGEPAAQAAAFTAGPPDDDAAGDLPPVEKSSPPRRLQLPELGLGAAFMSAVRSADRWLSGVQDGMKAFLQRVLPDEALLSLPVSLMAFIAVAIPLMVVAVSWTVYTRQGQVSAYDDYMVQAGEIIARAEGETDADALRGIYTDALAALDRAEQEQVTEQSALVRNQVQAAYDRLEKIERVTYQPAVVGGLPTGVVISRIVPGDQELYLLDAAQGLVIRAEQTERGYELDPSFLCGPGAQNGPLVDIALLPRQDLHPSFSEDSEVPRLLGVDANGNLLYCRPNDPPTAAALQPPDSNWGRIEAIRLDLGILYVLDPVTNAVWYYPGDQYLFAERPGFFFDEDVPTLRNAIDIAVDRSDLYILHDSSQVTRCVYSNLEIAPTRCVEPASFTDTRSGRQAGPTMVGTTFSQIQYAPPPEPSIYLLDSPTGAVYHFSVQLTLQRQYRTASEPSTGEATAFAVSPNRRLFLAIGDQLYVATLP
jgi:hypothetical protein